MKQSNAAGRLLTPDEVAGLLSVNRRYVRHLVDEGRLPVVRLGLRTPRFRLSDVEWLLEQGALND